MVKSPYACYLLTLPKFNSSPLKSYRNPIGKDRLPTIIFQGRAVKLRVIYEVFRISSQIDSTQNFFRPFEAWIYAT